MLHPTQSVPFGLLCGQYVVLMILRFNYLIQHACDNMKVVLQLLSSFTSETKGQVFHLLGHDRKA